MYCTFMPTFTIHRYGWMQEPKSSSPMPSAWAVSLLLGVTIPTTITATGKDVDTCIFKYRSIYRSIFIFWGSTGIYFHDLQLKLLIYLILALYAAP